jgi:hypothetical protein
MKHALWYLDTIRDAVSAPQSTSADALSEAAAEYHAACVEANRRLRQVARLLREGLRSEAIEIADHEPKLLELVAELDFSESDEWLGMAAQWGLPMPPEIDLSAAIELNSAYAELMPLEQLLQTHRKLALARAPLEHRIVVLRRIAEADLLNDAWKIDLESYERKRVQQIREEVRRLSKAGDLEALSALREEVQSGQWSIDLPVEVVQEIIGSENQQQVQTARRRLTELAPQIDAAYSEFDVERLSQLAATWRQNSEVAGLTAADPLQSQVSQALDWLAYQQSSLSKRSEFRAAIAKLEEALDQHADRSRLETLYHQAERFEQEIPPLLQQRVLERLDVQHTQSRRRGVLLGSLAAILIAVGAYGAVAYLRHNQRVALVESHVAKLSGLAGEEKWQELAAYLNRLPEADQQEPALAEYAVRAGAGLAQERERAATVDQKLTAMEQLADADLQPDAINSLREQSKLNDEVERIDALESRHQEHLRKMQKEIDDAFLRTVAKWTDRVEMLEKEVLPPSNELLTLLTQLEAELKQHTGVSPLLANNGQPVKAKLRAIYETAAKSSAYDEAFNRLIRSVGRLPEYQAALEKLSNEFADKPAGAHAADLLEQMADFEHTLKWATFWEELAPRWSGLTPDDAAAVITSGDALAAIASGSALATAFSQRKPHLEKLVARKEVDVDALKQFLVLNEYMSGVWMIVHNNGTRYYSPYKPQEKGDNIAFTYFVSYDQPPKQTTFPKGSLRSIALAPQAKLAQMLRGYLTQVVDQPDQWDASFFRMASEVRKAMTASTESNELDPVIGLQMFTRILSTGAEGSDLFGEAYRPVVTEIENAGIDPSVLWFAPDDDEAAAARLKARAAVTGIVDLAAQYRNARTRLSDVCLPPKYSYRWCGVLTQPSSRQWQCAPKLETQQSGTLFVVSSADGKADLTPVGQAVDGTVYWTGGMPSANPLIGQPLFLGITTTLSSN